MRQLADGSMTTTTSQFAFAGTSTHLKHKIAPKGDFVGLDFALSLRPIRVADTE